MVAVKSRNLDVFFHVARVLAAFFLVAQLLVALENMFRFNEVCHEAYHLLRKITETVAD